MEEGSYIGLVRDFSTAILILAAPVLGAQSLLINELQSSGPPGDRVEVFNASDHIIDLQGYVFALGAHQDSVVGSLPIAPGGHAVLMLDRRPEPGTDHLRIRLPREGGTLLLIAPDRSTVVDAFTYGALPEGCSMGRAPDGGRRVGYFMDPTFGTSTGPSPVVRRWLDPPRIESASMASGCEVSMHAAPGVLIRYTIDGGPPEAPHAAVYTGPITFAWGTCIKARAFAEDALPSPVACQVLLGPGDDQQVALVMDPCDLDDPWTGINVNGVHANHARRGKDWRRDAFFRSGDGTTTAAAKVSIAGSGSRGLPKRSFKVRADGGGPLLPGMPSAITLRADATPHAFLRNLFMEHIAREAGARVDVQPSRPVRLHLNGKDHGLYRLMPAKSAEWVRSLTGAEAVDLVEGPGARVVCGDRVDYERSMRALAEGGSAAGLDALIDLQSLIDLACFDLYTGRADHDLNVRCWRPKVEGGRWRWIMYDMDLWPPVEENAVERMMAGEPAACPYLPRLLSDPVLRDRLLTRLVALLNSVLAPEVAAAKVDALFNDHAHPMVADHARWSGEMEVPRPEATHALLLDHVRRRPSLLMAHLARQLRLDPCSLDVSVLPRGGGEVWIDGLRITGDHARLAAFKGSMLALSARAAEGMEFDGWVGADAEGPDVSIDPGKIHVLRAVFRLAAVSRRHGLKQAGE